MPYTIPTFEDRRALEAFQLERLRELIAALTPHNRFYAGKLAAGGAPLEFRSLREFTERAPFTFKHELVEDQRRHPPWGTNLTDPLERYTRFSQTSATTGRPLRWLDTPESWDWMLANWTRVFEAAGVGRQDRILFAFSFGPFLGFWTAFEAAARMGCLCLPAGGMRSAGRLQLMLEADATILCCTPTYAIRLAEVAAEERLDLRASRIRVILVAGEPGGSIPGTRRYIEQLWPGARVVDHHGMTEVGPVSYGCPRRRDVLHVIEASYLAEVIDTDTTQPAGPGATGELVLTTLGRTGSPLVRYRTGDLVRRAELEQCDCGSWDLALPGGILGRTDDMLVIRGVNVYPSAIEDVLRSDGGVAEYRVEVISNHGLAELHIRVEPARAGEDQGALVRRLEAAFHRAFSLRVKVTEVPRDTLPRFEMKATRWVFHSGGHDKRGGSWTVS
jgi:phenylacetate-CoA ligase